MVYILEDGRVLTDKSLIENEQYIELLEYPEPIYQDGKVGIIVGIENDAIKYEFVNIPEPVDPPIPQPAEQELLNAEFLLNQTEQSAKLKEIDEAIAVLLMNQTGGM